MARLLIVSRSMALAMRLADQHEVIEYPVDDLANLLPHVDADVLVLDLGDPVLAVNTVNTLREAEQDTPVLLVSGYQPEWEQVEAQQVEGVHVVPLPITRVALLYGVAILTGQESAINFIDTEDIVGAGPVRGSRLHDITPNEAAGQQETAETPEPDEGEHGNDREDGDDWDDADDADEADDVQGPDATQPIRNGAAESPEVTESNVAGLSYSASLTRPFGEEPRTGQLPIQYAAPRRTTAPHRWMRTNGAAARQEPAGQPPERQPLDNGNADGRRIPRLGDRPRKLQRHPGAANAPDPDRTPPAVGLVTDPLGPRTDPYGFPASALDRRLDAEAAALATGRPGVGEAGVSLRTAELVRMLHERAGDLYGVSDTAQVLADDVIERADADAAAILVPDGPIWRVSGGVGLRPLERRLVLEESHWLITEIGSAGRAVLIEDTDIIRQQLSGAPLAAWRHLLAVPVPAVRAIVVLARGQEGGPFSDRDLSAVIAPVREAATLLAQAVETRRLARVLSPLRESETDSTVRRRPAED